MIATPRAELVQSAYYPAQLAVARKFHTPSEADPSVCKCGTEFCMPFMQIKALDNPIT